MGSLEEVTMMPRDFYRRVLVFLSFPPQSCMVFPGSVTLVLSQISTSGGALQKIKRESQVTYQKHLFFLSWEHVLGNLDFLLLCAGLWMTCESTTIDFGVTNKFCQVGERTNKIVKIDLS